MDEQGKHSCILVEEILNLETMKIIHTADWHIGQNFFNHDRKEEHQNFFRQLRDIISKEKPNALLICGDVFDNGLPSSAARKLYTEELVNIHETLPQMQIVVIAGNHDSSSYLESDNQVWKLANVALVGRNSKPEDQIVKIRNSWICCRNPLFLSSKLSRPNWQHPERRTSKKVHTGGSR